VLDIRYFTLHHFINKYKTNFEGNTYIRVYTGQTSLLISHLPHEGTCIKDIITCSGHP